MNRSKNFTFDRDAIIRRNWARDVPVAARYPLRVAETSVMLVAPTAEVAVVKELAYPLR